MAATVTILSLHDATGSTSAAIDGGAIRYKQADNDTVDANNPIPIPGAGTAYSWIKHFRFNAVTTPANTINGLKVYTDGSNTLGTGCDLKIKTSASYLNPITNATTALTGSPSSAFTYNSGAALAVTGSISNPSTGPFGDFIQTQFEVGTTAAQGTSGSETLTFSYDES